jgi:acyl-CoA reductase-like NAD-dependent aldehyde dehydrogenase
LVERGREEGADVVAGGRPLEGKGAFYPPTVLAKVDNRMAVAQEEIFGPVVTSRRSRTRRMRRGSPTTSGTA